MTNIIVALPTMEDAKNIKNILVKCGMKVTAVTTTGAGALSQADDLHDGILLCSHRLKDMVYTQLAADLPPGFMLLLLAPPRVLEGAVPDTVDFLPMPFTVAELIRKVSLLSEEVEGARKKRRLQPKVRSKEEEAIIAAAKDYLGKTRHMSEAEAHKYLQKRSMDNGTDLVETARVLLLLAKEAAGLQKPPKKDRI